MFTRRMQTVIPDPVKPFGQHMLHHAANKSEHRQLRYFTLTALMVVVPIPHVLPVRTQEAPKRDRRAHHVLGQLISQTLTTARDLPLL